jgi:IMP dehydrogenase
MSKKFYYALGKTVTWPKFPASFLSPGSLTYDDVLLVPQAKTEVTSRKSVDIGVKFGPWQLSVPIISAPMDTVSGPIMIEKLAALGAIGTLPRSRDFAESLKWCRHFSDLKIPCVYSLGLHNPVEEARELEKTGAQMVLLDVAHGGMAAVLKMTEQIKQKTGLWVMAGNIATYEQAVTYQKAGVDIARVGVGPGGACSTRLVAGTGMPQLSAVMETTASKIMVIADGGIKHPGHAAKALAAGASLVMIGSMFAGTEETPGEVKNGLKAFRGQASEAYMKDNGHSVDGFRAAEGINTQVAARGSVELVVNEITGGIRSAMSYTGAANLAELNKLAVFTLISDATKKENRPHILDQAK